MKCSSQRFWECINTAFSGFCMLVKHDTIADKQSNHQRGMTQSNLFGMLLCLQVNIVRFQLIRFCHVQFHGKSICLPSGSAD